MVLVAGSRGPSRGARRPSPEAALPVDQRPGPIGAFGKPEVCSITCSTRHRLLAVGAELGELLGHRLADVEHARR